VLRSGSSSSIGLRTELARFAFLLGEDDGEQLLGTD
jgi:hypothetical protein